MRLIDADEIGLTDFEIVMCNGDYKEALKMLLDKISNQPTAYSVENVVEELEKAKTINVYVGSGTIYKTIRKDSAIEIVKQGGVSDDVCEWKKSKDYPFDWLVGCDGCEVNHRQGDYCPVCGKKIKVVE